MGGGAWDFLLFTFLQIGKPLCFFLSVFYLAALFNILKHRVTIPCKWSFKKCMKNRALFICFFICFFVKSVLFVKSAIIMKKHLCFS